MQFQSTRDPNTIVSSSEAILRGLAPDGGLFVPTAFPKAELEDWKSLSYPELAQKVLAGFLTDYDPAFLGEAADALMEMPLPVRRVMSRRFTMACTRWNCGTARPAPSRTMRSS